MAVGNSEDPQTIRSPRDEDPMAPPVGSFTQGDIGMGNRDVLVLSDPSTPSGEPRVLLGPMTVMMMMAMRHDGNEGQGSGRHRPIALSRSRHTLQLEATTNLQRSW